MTFQGDKEMPEAVPAGFESKQDWSSAYTAEYPTLYRNELMGKCQIHRKNESLKRIFDHELLETCKVVSQVSELAFVDVLSAYGDCTLAIVNGMEPDEIFEAWSSEQKSVDISHDRRFKCKTTGIDISKNALKYAQSVNIFDEVIKADINNLSSQEKDLLFNCFMSSDIVHLGSPGYMSLESFVFTVDSFAQGNSDFGYFIVSFNNVFMKFHKEFKQYILDKLKFIDCAGGFQRTLLPSEEKYYGLSNLYNTTWIMKR
jgi:hypothetical protein